MFLVASSTSVRVVASSGVLLLSLPASVLQIGIFPWTRSQLTIGNIEATKPLINAKLDYPLWSPVTCSIALDSPSRALAAVNPILLALNTQESGMNCPFGNGESTSREFLGKASYPPPKQITSERIALRNQ